MQGGKLNHHRPSFVFQHDELSEDCLYAKIIARKDSVISSSDEKRNVLAWLHGGTFNFGGADATYESPDNLVAEHDLIVAKLNYRLG